MTREADLVRQRVSSVLRHFGVARMGASGLVITAPRAAAAQRARLIRLVTTTAQLTFYDWEANVVAPNGRTAAWDLKAQDASVVTLSQGTNGGPGQPGAGSVPLYDAVRLAAKQPRRALSRFDARRGAEYYMFGAPGSAACAAAAAAAHTALIPGTHCLLAGPVDVPARQQAMQMLAAQFPPGVSPSAGQVLVVPQGTRVLQAVAPDQVSFASPAAQFFVLRDHSALIGNILNPRRTADAAGQADLSFGFTAAGERAFQLATRDIARRGAEASALGETLNQHFAIVLDGRLLTVPSIDFRQYPDGIRTTQADITGGFTRQAAADLATQLRYGALPLALRVVR
jgi:SecD/SecF fusion protein